MILAHTFTESDHVYRVPGRYVLSTSDVIELAGLSEMGQIPIQQLRNACERGKAVHKAIEEYEMGRDWQSAFDETYMPFMESWFAFRDEHSIQVLPPMEQRYCYQHEGTEQAIGATIDLRFLMDGDLFIGDLKTIYPLSGKALRLKKLAWRLQLQSYAEVTEMDEEFLSGFEFQRVRRVIIHLHPKLKVGFQLFEPLTDDALLWDGACRLAMEKVAAGVKPSKRVDLNQQEEEMDYAM